MNINKVKINNELIFRCKPDFFTCRLKEQNDDISLCMAPTQCWVDPKSKNPNETCKVQASSHIFSYKFIGRLFSLCFHLRLFCVQGMYAKVCVCVCLCAFIHSLIHRSCFNQSPHHYSWSSSRLLSTLPWSQKWSPCFGLVPLQFILHNNTQMIYVKLWFEQISPLLEHLSNLPPLPSGWCPNSLVRYSRHAMV